MLYLISVRKSNCWISRGLIFNARLKHHQVQKHLNFCIDELKWLTKIVINRRFTCLGALLR